MTFANPLALALLVAIPLAWWLHRRRRSATVVRVASLLAFRGAAATTPSAAPRRATDWRLVLVLTSMALLAVAAAGPSIGGTRPAMFYVVNDDSASMSGLRDRMRRRATTLLREVDPNSVDVVAALIHDETRGASFSLAPDGLPGSLADHLRRAREADVPGVVLVTDSRIDALPGVAVIGPETGARSNVAVVGAALDGETALVTVRNFGPKDERVVLRRGTELFDQVSISGNTFPPAVNEWAESVPLTVPAGATATARLSAPDQAGWVYAIWTEEGDPRDDLRADDRIVVARRGRPSFVRLSPAVPSSLRAALSATGGKLVDRGPSEVLVAYGADAASATAAKVLAVAPGETTEFGEIRAVLSSSPLVRGDAVIGRAEFADVLPAPSTTLVAPTRLVGGEPIWSDSEGVLVAATADAVVIAVDPEDARGEWRRDPSFPALIASALDRLGGGPDRLELLYAVPSSESDVVHDPPRTSTSEELRAVMRPAGPVPDAVRPAPWLALAAAALLVTAAFVRGR